MNRLKKPALIGNLVQHVKEDREIDPPTRKAAARALDQATQMDPRIEGVMSTKGKL